MPTRVPHLGPCEGSWLGCPAASSIVACPPTRSLAGGSAVQRALGSLHPPQPCAGHLDAAWARTAHRVAVSACPVRGPPMPDSQGTGRVWGGLERLCCARQRRRQGGVLFAPLLRPWRESGHAGPKDRPPPTRVRRGVGPWLLFVQVGLFASAHTIYSCVCVSVSFLGNPTTTSRR